MGRQQKLKAFAAPITYSHCLTRDLSETDPHGNIMGDKEILVSMVDDNPKPKKSELPPSFQDMQRHGIRITGYTTTQDR